MRGEIVANISKAEARTNVIALAGTAVGVLALFAVLIIVSAIV